MNFQKCPQPEYAGFWLRVLAALIDTVFVIMLTFPLLYWVFGTVFPSDAEAYSSPGLFIQFGLPAIAVIALWLFKSATPGKMMLKMEIVDAQTGGKPTLMQFIVRYLGYYVSMIPACLGLIWVGLDKRKQGWHDKMAGTVVIRRR
ncbi:MAG: RDD family protein [Betaproteobacteria bacterium]|nr:RDD family protein [Betaproteobacteria bacterium]